MDLRWSSHTTEHLIRPPSCNNNNSLPNTEYPKSTSMQSKPVCLRPLLKAGPRIKKGSTSRLS